MTALVTVLLGALAGLGIFLTVAGIMGRAMLSSGGRSPRTAGAVRLAKGSEVWLAWAFAAFLVGVVVYSITGWPVAALGAAALVSLAPRWIAARRDAKSYTERTQAVASWIEMVRDNMAGSAGLEQALQVSASLAPKPIEPEMRRFSQRVERQPLGEALEELGSDLKNPAADMAIAALVNASRLEVRELGPLLGRLAAATRSEVQMRLRVEVGRARVRTSARIVVVTTVLTILFLIAFSGELLAVYDTAAGQLWMVLVGGVFFGGAMMLRHYGQLDMPPRFEPRRQGHESGPRQGQEAMFARPAGDQPAGGSRR